MINYIEVGKLVPADKEIRKQNCDGTFPIFWDEVQRNYSNKEQFKGFSELDWRSAYDRALNLDYLGGSFMTAPNHVSLDIIAKYFFLGRSHHEWVKHFDRAGYISASPPSYDLTQSYKPASE